VKAFLVVFEWPAASKIPARSEWLEASDADEAKMEAAMMFGCEEFEHGLPSRYLVFDKAGGLVFHYPDGR
jgi:hypothetical protein